MGKKKKKRNGAAVLSLAQALKMPAKKINQMPENSEVKCGNGWGIFRSTSSVRSGIFWYVGKEGVCILSEYGNPMLVTQWGGEHWTFKSAYETWLKNKDRLTTPEIRRILHQMKIDDEDSYG